MAAARTACTGTLAAAQAQWSAAWLTGSPRTALAMIWSAQGTPQGVMGA